MPRNISEPVVPSQLRTFVGTEFSLRIKGLGGELLPPLFFTLENVCEQDVGVSIRGFSRGQIFRDTFFPTDAKVIARRDCTQCDAVLALIIERGVEIFEFRLETIPPNWQDGE